MVVGFYFVTSISLVFLNKILLSGYDFPYPLFITWYAALERLMLIQSLRYQLIVAIVLLVILGVLGQQCVPYFGSSCFADLMKVPLAQLLPPVRV